MISGLALTPPVCEAQGVARVQAVSLGEGLCDLDPCPACLSQLTLGAFIGSYVQRSVSERIASGEQVLSPRPPGGPGRERV